MHPQELWWLIEAKCPEASDPIDYDELYSLLDPLANEKLKALENNV